MSSTANTAETAMLSMGVFGDSISADDRTIGRALDGAPVLKAATARAVAPELSASETLDNTPDFPNDATPAPRMR